MTVNKLEELFKQGGGKPTKVKAMGSGADFGGMMDAINAMGATATTATGMYGSSNSSAVLAAAFSGINAASAQGLGSGGAPYMASGSMGGSLTYGMKGMSAGDSALGGVGSSSTTPVVAGTEGFSQMDMINTMNQNNLQLLELQAVMQSNMQSWNTKSNILSADHRARMAMIEKFTARG